MVSQNAVQLGFDIKSGKSEIKETMFDGVDDPENIHSLESMLQFLQNRVDVLEAGALATEKEKNLLSHQLAEHVDSVVGLREAIETKQPALKSIWILLVFAGLALTVYFMHETIAEYLANPTLTRVGLNAELQYEYPPLILCNHAWFDTEKATKMGLSPDGLRYALGYLDLSRMPQVTVQNISEARANFLKVLQNHNFETLADFYEHLAVRLNQTVSKDEFFNSTTPAYFVEDFLKKARLVFGSAGDVCHLFEFQPLDGKTGSLIEALAIHVKYGTEDNSSPWLLFFVDGAAKRYAWPLMVPSSAKNNLRIQAQLFIGLNTDDHPCVDDPVGNYSSAGCMADCQGDYHKEQFGCRKFYMASGERKRQPVPEYCNFFDRTEGSISYERIYQYYRAPVLNNEGKNLCFVQCPRYCRRSTFDASLQGTDTAYDWFFGEEEDEVVRRQNMSVTTFGILHDAMRQGGLVKFTEVASYSFVELANNVGGTLGLFVGGALMTFAQLILFLMGILGQQREMRRVAISKKK